MECVLTKPKRSGNYSQPLLSRSKPDRKDQAPNPEALGAPCTEPCSACCASCVSRGGGAPMGSICHFCGVKTPISDTGMFLRSAEKSMLQSNSREGRIMLTIVSRKGLLPQNQETAGLTLPVLLLLQALDLKYVHILRCSLFIRWKIHTNKTDIPRFALIKT